MTVRGDAAWLEPVVLGGDVYVFCQGLEPILPRGEEFTVEVTGFEEYED